MSYESEMRKQMEQVAAEQQAPPVGDDIDGAFGSTAHTRSPIGPMIKGLKKTKKSAKTPYTAVKAKAKASFTGPQVKGHKYVHQNAHHPKKGLS